MTLESPDGLDLEVTWRGTSMPNLSLSLSLSSPSQACHQDPFAQRTAAAFCRETPLGTVSPHGGSYWGREDPSC